MRYLQRETVCDHRPIEHTDPGTHPSDVYESRNEGFLSVKVCASDLRGRISALLIYHGQGHQVAEDATPCVAYGQLQIGLTK